MTEEKKYGVPTAEQLAKINRFTKRPFTAEEVFVFPVKMIGNALIPGRYIKLDKSLLEVYAKDGQNGDVAYMLNHRWSAWFGLSDQKGVINLGRVFDSWLQESHDLPDETVAQYGWVYIPRNREKDGVSTNEVIESIEDGTLRDVSVGIGWSVSECSVCGNDIRNRSKCEHYPGRTYDDKLCYIIAKPPGDEFELSGVFAGAYPTAEALSANPGEAEPDDEGSVQVLSVEEIKNVPEGAQVFAAFSENNVTLFVRKGALTRGASFSIGSDTTAKGGEKVADEKKSPWEVFGAEAEKHGLSAEQATAVLNKVAELAEKQSVAVMDLAGNLDDMVLGTVLNTEPLEGAVALDRKKVVEVLGKEMDADSILSLAREGQVLKAELVDDTLEWGVRALGNGFARDFYAQMLSEPGRTIEAIKNLREQFKAQAKEALKSGRVTEPMDKQAKSRKREVPDTAFKA